MKKYLRPLNCYNYYGGLEEANKILKSIISEDDAFGRSFRFATIASEFNKKTADFLAKGGRTTSDQVDFGIKKIQEVIDAYDKQIDELKFSPRGNDPRRVDCIILKSHLGVYLKYAFVNTGILTIVIHEDESPQKKRVS